MCDVGRGIAQLAPDNSLLTTVWEARQECPKSRGRREAVQNEKFRNLSRMIINYSLTLPLVCRDSKIYSRYFGHYLLSYFFRSTCTCTSVLYIGKAPEGSRNCSPFPHIPYFVLSYSMYGGTKLQHGKIMSRLKE